MTDPRFAQHYQGGRDNKKYSQGHRGDPRMDHFGMGRSHVGMDNDEDFGTIKIRSIYIDETNSKYLTVQDDLDSDIDN